MPEHSTGRELPFLPETLTPFFENPVLTVGALLAAFAIWYYIRGKVEDEVVAAAELNLNVKGEYVITGKRLKNRLIRDRIQIRLRGPKSKLQQIKDQQTLVVSKTIDVTENMDLSSPVEVKITDRDLTLKDQDLPFGVHMVSQGLILTVRIQEDVEQTRTIARQDPEENRNVFTVGQPASDFRIEEVVPQVKTVDIKGPRDLVNQARVVPVSPINVSGQASDVTKQVELTTDPMSEHIKLSVQNVAVTVKIVSKLTEKQIQKPFEIASGPKLSSYLQERGWNFEPGNRELTITFRVPRSMEKQFGPGDVYPILMLPEEEVQAIKDPTRPHTVSTEDFIWVIIDRSIENRNRIKHTNIKPETIKFVPLEAE